MEPVLLQARAILEEAGFRIDYVEVADAVPWNRWGSRGRQTGESV